MKIAIVGTGISGNVAAYHLCRDHDITVFEANDYVGGHTHTHSLNWAGRTYKLDSGFIVFNNRTYPAFRNLLQELAVPVQPSSMSFSVKCERTGLEYNGTTLNTLFAQRRNVCRPSFYRMIKDILRFNRQAPRCLSTCQVTMTLGDFLRQGAYGKDFIAYYLIPMGSAIWSADPQQIYNMPAQFFIRFFDNHGMLSIGARPTWYVIQGGSATYVEKLTAPFRNRILTNAPIERIKRSPTCVIVKVRHQPPERFDAVFLATHSDQALRVLDDATPLEAEILSPMLYQQNEAVLHTDEAMLPKRRLAWAAWNYHLPAHSQPRATVTYNLNILQGIQAPVQFCVTLNNRQDISPDTIIKRMRYHHPVFTPQSVSAQQRQEEINGRNRTFFCGAYWGYGFHEDGVVSALRALDHFRRTPRHEQLSVQRVGAASSH